MMVWLHQVEDESLQEILDWVRVSGIETLSNPGFDTRPASHVHAVAAHGEALWQHIDRAGADPSPARSHFEKILGRGAAQTDFDLHRGIQYALGTGLEIWVRAASRHAFTVTAGIRVQAFFVSYCELRTGPARFPLLPRLASKGFQRIHLDEYSARSDLLYLTSAQLRETLAPLADEPALPEVEQAVRDGSVYVSRGTDHSWRLQHAMEHFGELADFVERGVLEGLAWISRESGEDADYD